MRHRRVALRKSSIFLLLAVLGTALPLAACGSSPAPSPSPSPSAVAAASTVSAITPLATSVAALHAPLVGLVVQTSLRFDAAETAYLSRCNMAWQTIQRGCAEAAKASHSGDAGAGANGLSQTIASTTARWLRMKAPSQRFAPLHKQVTVLAKHLGAASRLAQAYDAASSQARKDDLAAKLTSSGATIAVLADRVASKAEDLRFKYGEAWYPEPPPTTPVTPTVVDNQTTTEATTTISAVAITAAEEKQLKALLADRSWITDPLREGMAMMKAAPVSEWGLGDVFNFCLDMGFVQATCQEWMKKKPAGPTIAYSFDQDVSGLRLLNKAAKELIYMAENQSISAGYLGAKYIKEATPYIGRAMAGFEVLLPSAFKK